MKEYLRKGDIIIIASVLVIALLFYIPGIAGSGEKENLTADIIADGETVRSVNLSAVTSPYEEKINNTKIVIGPGKIKFVESDCRDKICVSSGELTKAGQVAACVPNRVAIQLRSRDGDRGGVDAVTY